ncbi:hypothetical protein SAMN05216299_105110 [Nitrosospira sp. Nsp14]|uniref:hypothetical protein n=1 Tax=Nitrosospira sp. Nsp14 TaxID=1855333 RepID=UPI0008EF03DE|nr:hypothetical protein [Nitrosospira sp. Nsp14]SFH29055.1 hypothetical protein SAMN05216299_105110 [Nitrosospira sp. Nsp14]
MPKQDTKNDGPPVRLLLAVLSWLTTRSGPIAARPNTANTGRANADQATRLAIAHHFHLLVLHPASDSIDIQAGIYMADRAGMDAADLLARFPGSTARRH